MKSNYLIIFVLLTTLIIGCKSGSNGDDLNESDSTNVEKIDTTITQVDTSTIEEDTTEDEVKYEDPEVQEAHKEIVKKFGIQWDFCTCIKKSDSVNTALMEASDEDFDVVMERSEYIDSKCKGMLIQPNATPEERMKHEKKVKNCLAQQ